MISYSLPKNLELNPLNPNEINQTISIKYDCLLIHYLNQIRIVSLAEMKVDRVIDDISGKIECVGAFEDGVYSVTSDKRDFWLNLYYKDVVSDPTIIVLESRILAHTSFELENTLLLVTISVDKFLRVYDISNYTWALLLEKQFYYLSQIEVDSIEIIVMLKSEWIWVILNQSTLIYISIRDWHWSYPIAGEVFNILTLTEYSDNNDYWAIVWDNYDEGKDGKRHPFKMLSLIKMPPENDDGTYEVQHHKIPGGDWINILDLASTNQTILLLVKTENHINLLLFKNEGSKGFSFKKLSSLSESKHLYSTAKIFPDTYMENWTNGETSVYCWFIFPRWLNIGTFEFKNTEETIGSREHANRFSDHIKITSNKNLLNKGDQNIKLQILSDDEIKEALKLGYFEQIGSILMFKQTEIDGFQINMGDLRDFIEQWTIKFESIISNRVIEPLLKHFKPIEYGSLFDKTSDLSKKILETQKSVEGLSKLYKFIFHRRVLEGKEKQVNLNSNRLNLRDTADINMIERRWVKIESTIRLLKYFSWFLKTNFFTRYQYAYEGLVDLHNKKSAQK